MGLELHRLINLTRDCQATLIPAGQKMMLSQGESVSVTQALGGSFTVRTMNGYLARIDAHDAGALGLEGVGKFAALSGVWEFPLRVKCATLAWHTLRNVLEGRNGGLEGTGAQISRISTE